MGMEGEKEEFGQGQLHDQDVHVSDAFQVPVGGVGIDEGEELVVVEDGFTEEFAGKFFVFPVFEFGQQGLVFVGLLPEIAQGFNDHGHHQVNVVIPVDAFLFQDQVQFLGGQHDVLEDFFRKAAVVGKGAFFEVFTIEGRFGEEGVEFPDEFGVVDPGGLAWLR